MVLRWQCNRDVTLSAVKLSSTYFFPCPLYLSTNMHISNRIEVYECGYTYVCTKRFKSQGKNKRIWLKCTQTDFKGIFFCSSHFTIITFKWATIRCHIICSAVTKSTVRVAKSLSGRLGFNRICFDLKELSVYVWPILYWSHSTCSFGLIDVTCKSTSTPSASITLPYTKFNSLDIPSIFV